jgi:hypothetical protein
MILVFYVELVCFFISNLILKNNYYYNSKHAFNHVELEEVNLKRIGESKSYSPIILLLILISHFL